jgi:dTDP-glucose 4,6-dehydratase/UDP-glucose 4-epimerase
LIDGKPIQVFGDGMQLRDFNFVDDCVRAMLLAAERNDAIGKVYNLGSTEVISLKDLAALMTSLVPGTGFDIVPFPPERKAIDIGDYYGDFSLIERELGWSPKIDLRGGLEMTLAYFRRHAAHYWEARP